MTDTTQTTDHAEPLAHAIHENTVSIYEAIEDQLTESSFASAVVALNDIDHKTVTLAKRLDEANTTATRLRLALIEMATVYLHSDVTDRAIRRGTIRNVLATNRVADQVGIELGDMDAGRGEGGGA